MPPAKTVVHYRDGRILKGFTRDFAPHRETFELAADDSAEAQIEEIWAPDLKAVFFVRDFAGNRDRVDRKDFDPDHPVAGQRLQVRFQDGEEMVGTAQDYDPLRKGFFFVPADPQSNIVRCYVVVAATREITFR